MIIALSGQSLF